MRKQPEGGSVAPGRLANSLPCRQRAERVSSGRDALSSASAGPSSRRRGLLVEETGAKGVARSRRLISASFGDWRPSTMRFAPPIRTRLSSVRGHVEGESRHAAVAARATYTRPRNRRAPGDRGKTPRARDDLRGGDGSLDSACTSGSLGSGEMQRRERETCAALAPERRAQASRAGGGAVERREGSTARARVQPVQGG